MESARGVRARENPMKQFVRTSFLGTRPSCPPTPDDGFSTPTTENRIYDWAAQAGQFSQAKRVWR